MKKSAYAFLFRFTCLQVNTMYQCFYLCFVVKVLKILYLSPTQVFLLHPPVRVTQGNEIHVNFSMSRSEENHRLMNVDLAYEIKLSSGKMLPPVRNKFYIE